MKCACIASALFVGLLDPLPANAWTGNLLYESCAENKGSAGDVACSAYVRGFLDGIGAGNAIAKNFPGLYCPPKTGIEFTQGRLVIEKYLKEHPETLHLEAALILGVAMIEAFPCPKNSN
jgi:hypothetical protein